MFFETMVGGTGGEYLRHLTQGFLKSITVGPGDDCIGFISISFSDSCAPKEFGLLRSPKEKTFEFKSGEFITSLSLWKSAVKAYLGDWDSTLNIRLGGLRFRTNHGNEFYQRMTQDLGEEVPVEVGSGVAVGFKIRYGCEIDSFGLVFLPQIESVTVITVDGYSHELILSPCYFGKSYLLDPECDFPVCEE